MTADSTASTPWRSLGVPIAAMALVIVLSNVTVQYPINAWLTWGAFTYPLVFLVCDLTNRAIGPQAARKVAWAGFAVAVLVSGLLAPWRIALASGAAFIVSQLLDVLVFNRWRRASWWKAPLIGSQVASVVEPLADEPLPLPLAEADPLSRTPPPSSVQAAPASTRAEARATVARAKRGVVRMGPPESGWRAA